jgi:poly-gamma-glutamate synthesis protein (capsule biosynthesis protein)
MLQRILIVALLFGFLFTNACSVQVATLQPTSQEKTIPVISLWLPPYLPPEMVRQMHLPENIIQVDRSENADLRLDVGSDDPVTTWVYALVAPFPTVSDGVTLADFRMFWSGEVVAGFPARRLLVDGSTQAIFTKVWGEPASGNVASVSSQGLLATAGEEKTTWAVIPFEKIEPQWKVIQVDGSSPIHKDFDPKTYGLSVPFSFSGKAELVAELSRNYGLNAANAIFPAINRDPEKMTVVALTGVTALVRGTAYLMEKYGMTYPAIDIGSILRGADITHISNEIPFWLNCPKPFSNAANDRNLVFCSRPDYIQLLEAVGTDVVELTGDHFRDWGPAPMLYTLNMYDQHGWKYYGGGRNLEDGEKPALFDHNGNKIAFLGCNAKPEGYATATATSPGAVHCDLDVMSQKIREVIQQGYQPIFTFQHIEYYKYMAKPYLVADFQKVAEAGAVIVSGSQAHQPQALEFYHGALLHYGLGNLFFDQFDEGNAQRKAFIDLHIFYNGSYINTELVSIMFIDNARARLMTAEERTTLLNDIFFASNW